MKSPRYLLNFTITLLLFIACKPEVIVENNLDWANLSKYKDANTALMNPSDNEQRVVFMGNSITEGWTHADSTFFANPSYINRGISGQTTPQMLIRFRPDVIDLHPQVVVILAGINDIAGNTGPMTIDEIYGNIQSMAQLANHHGIKVVLSSVLPAYDFPWRPGLNPAPKVIELNEKIKSYCAANDHTYLDYFSHMVDSRDGLKEEYTYDEVHPTKEGYQVMAPLAKAAIELALSK